MDELAATLVRGAIVGLGGALAMDLWGLVLRRGFGIPTLDYALLGRWIGGMPAGRVTVARIAAAPPVPGERPLGTAAHYAIGVAFAWLLLAITGPGWLAAPTLVPALAVGLGTVVAPWFVMQPAMGAGIAGSRTPDPRATRLRNLGTHAVYGIGMWLTALALAAVELAGR
jgi:hypothetical protein